MRLFTTEPNVKKVEVDWKSWAAAATTTEAVHAVLKRDVELATGVKAWGHDGESHTSTNLLCLPLQPQTSCHQLAKMLESTTCFLRRDCASPRHVPSYYEEIVGVWGVLILLVRVYVVRFTSGEPTGTFTNFVILLRSGLCDRVDVYGETERPAHWLRVVGNGHVVSTPGPTRKVCRLLSSVSTGFLGYQTGHRITSQMSLWSFQRAMD